jgi:transposase
MEAPAEKEFRETVLDEIDSELATDLKRKIFAASRLLLIKRFEEHLKKEADRLGTKFRKTKVIEEYCSALGIHRGTYYDLLQKYREHGIAGLFRQRRQRASKFSADLIPVTLAILEPGKGYKTTYDKLVDICEQKGLKTPSYRTFINIAAAYGLTGVLVPGKATQLQKARRSHAPGKPEISPTHSSIKDGQYLWTTLKVDLRDPLSCLGQLWELIDQEPSFSEDRRNILLHFLDKYSHLTTYDPRKYCMAYLSPPLTEDEKKKLEAHKAGNHVYRKKRATAILMANDNLSMLEIVMELDCHVGTVYDWLRKFREKGVDFVLAKKDFSKNNEELKERTDRLIRILRQSPHDYNINRTTWIQKDLVRVYEKEYGKTLSGATIRLALKKANHTWKSARSFVPTPDPEYRQKTKKVMETLHNMEPKDAFFFIDEAGPYQVKKWGGKSWTEKGTTKFVPQFQTPKGRVSLIAALDAVKNQVVMFFTKHKNTKAVIALIRVLYFKYHHYKTLYITWDAASWHKSKGVQECIDKLNARKTGPRVKIVPLPKRSQYLNVIESVFTFKMS